MEKQLKIIVELLPEAFDKQKGLFALREAELLDIIKCYKSEPNAKMAQEIIRLRDKNTKLENELQHGQKCLETVLGEQTE
jgi:methyl coenzyme M reductase subunit D